MYVDETKLAVKKQNIDPMRKEHMKEVDLGEPTSFLDHVYLGCTQRECETSKDIVENYRDMFETKISAGATEKLPCQNISAWSYDRKSCKEMCEAILRTGEQNNSATVQSRNPMP